MNCFTACNGGDACCSKMNKCGEDEGDCDSDSHCKDGLKCGNSNCSQKSGYQWDATDDCCYSKKLYLEIHNAAHRKYIYLYIYFNIFVTDFT